MINCSALSTISALAIDSSPLTIMLIVSYIMCYSQTSMNPVAVAVAGAEAGTEIRAMTGIETEIGIEMWEEV